MQRKDFLVAVGSSALIATAPAQRQSALTFDFHSSFWINLHHRLFMQAQAFDAQKRSPLLPGGGAWNTLAYESLHEMQLTASQMSAWNGALEQYSRYTDFNLLDEPMSSIASALTIPDAQLPAPDKLRHQGLVQALLAAAPVYRTTQWPQDDRANRQWIAEVSPRATAVSSVVTVQLRHGYGDPFPIGPFRVDLTTFANWAGCYTNTDPVHIFISPRDMRNSGKLVAVPDRGNLALEMLFHEASHSVVTPGYGEIGRAIENAAARRNAIEPDGLWHAFIFYTAGAVARATFAGSAYTTAADRLGLWSDSWAHYDDALARHWQPFLDRGGSRALAVDSVVRTVLA